MGRSIQCEHMKHPIAMPKVLYTVFSFVIGYHTVHCGIRLARGLWFHFSKFTHIQIIKFRTTLKSTDIGTSTVPQMISPFSDQNYNGGENWGATNGGLKDLWFSEKFCTDIDQKLPWYNVSSIFDLYFPNNDQQINAVLNGWRA